MKKFVVSTLVVLSALGSAIFFAAPAQAAGLTESQAQTIIQLLTAFGADANVISDVRAALLGQTTSSSRGSKATRQNLSISSIALSLPAGIGSGANIPVADQQVTVTVKNNEFGSFQLSGEKFKYAIYLYEVTGSKNKKLVRAATGEALVPYANGYSEFSAFIEGGMPFDGTNFEKEYQAEVIIDTGNKIKESSERDNKMRSNSWLVDFYKG